MFLWLLESHEKEWIKNLCGKLKLDLNGFTQYVAPPTPALDNSYSCGSRTSVKPPLNQVPPSTPLIHLTVLSSVCVCVGMCVCVCVYTYIHTYIYIIYWLTTTCKHQWLWYSWSNSHSKSQSRPSTKRYSTDGSSNSTVRTVDTSPHYLVRNIPITIFIYVL